MRFRTKGLEVPVLLPEKDAKILAQYKSRVEVFDRMFKCCCCWIGWDIILDFIPVIADISYEVKSQMRWHTLVNFVFGLIPGVGLAFDILYQANAKNLKLFEQFLYARARSTSAQPLYGSGSGSTAPSKSIPIHPTLV